MLSACRFGIVCLCIVAVSFVVVSFCAEVVGDKRGRRTHMVSILFRVWNVTKAGHVKITALS